MNAFFISAKKQRGSSLIEVLVALAIVSIALVAVMSTITLVVRSQRSSEQHQHLVYYAKQPLEWLHAYREKVGWAEFVASLQTATADSHSVWCVPTLPALPTVVDGTTLNTETFLTTVDGCTDFIPTTSFLRTVVITITADEVTAVSQARLDDGSDAELSSSLEMNYKKRID